MAIKGYSPLERLCTTHPTPLQHIDQRSDAEITEAIETPEPIKSQKNVWAFWDKGFSKMQSWSQRNVIGWVRLLGPEWTVRVLNIVPGSPANITNFIDSAYLPASLKGGSMSGRYAGQHASDVVRLASLYQHGGIWLDVGAMLFTHLDQIWNQVSSPASRFELALASADPSLKAGIAENFFIIAPKANAFIHRWLAIFLEVWKGRNSCEGLSSHPLFKHIVEGGNVGPFLRLASPAKLDYFVTYLAYERLRLLQDPNDGWSGSNYCSNKILLIPYQEFASAAMLTHDSGQQQFRYLVTRYDDLTKIDTTEYRQAQQFCDHMLRRTTMMRLYHWKEADNHNPTLADLWDKSNDELVDSAPGTFAEYMRFVSTHYDQQRDIIPLDFPVITEELLYAGLLETDDD